MCFSAGKGSVVERECEKAEGGRCGYSSVERGGAYQTGKAINRPKLCFSLSLTFSLLRFKLDNSFYCTNISFAMKNVQPVLT